MTVSRRPPLNGTWDRSTPSRLNPQRSATLCDAWLSGLQVSSRRASPRSLKAQPPSSRTAREATPPTRVSRQPVPEGGATVHAVDVV